MHRATWVGVSNCTHIAAPSQNLSLHKLAIQVSKCERVHLDSMSAYFITDDIALLTYICNARTGTAYSQFVPVVAQPAATLKQMWELSVRVQHHAVDQGASSRTYMLEQGGYPVQLQHMLFPHVPLQFLNALMRLQISDGSVAGSNGRWHRALQAKLSFSHSAMCRTALNNSSLPNTWLCSGSIAQLHAHVYTRCFHSKTQMAYVVVHRQIPLLARRKCLECTPLYRPHSKSVEDTPIRVHRSPCADL